MTSAERTDVVVVGAGNAGFCAAHAAAEQGARVLLLEKAQHDRAGGNSYYTAGAFRFALDSVNEVADLLDEHSTSLLDRSVVPSYPRSAFEQDMRRVTGDRCDPELTDVLVSRSTDAVRWLAGKGIRWRLMFERQSYVSDGKHVFFGGLYVGTVGGGKGLIEQHTAAAERAGVEIRYGAQVTDLHLGAERGVTYRAPDGVEHRVRAGAVVLTAGGFEADPQRRRQHLGEGWEKAYVRGAETNTGDVLDLALAAGAAAHGDWTSCHSVAWDSGADPTRGDRELTNQLTRQSYPIGIVVNRDGQRFVDEGADFRNYTYAKYGREILRQPDGYAVQLFDAKTRPLLRTEEYDSRPITAARADSLEELARQVGVDPDGLRRTVEEFNAAIVDEPFDPAVKDGRAARVDPPKSNWALELDTPPYYGFCVGCGITFTFGGLHVDRTATVLDGSGQQVPGLHAAGEMVGGLFSGNYPGGSGLTSGSVFGRLAGASAAAAARG
jgi:tricarballylate dehydrogenase